jgi:hypothetical protein
MVEKKTRGKASMLVIIHVGSLENVQSACHIGVTCIRGYTWICGEQFQKFMDLEMHFQS